MRQTLAVALVCSVGLPAAWSSSAHAAAACQTSTRIHPGAFNLTLNNGDTSIVRVTGYKGTNKAAPPSPDVTVHVKSGVPVVIGDIKSGAAVQVAPNITANIVVDASPKPNDAASTILPPSPSPRPGGPDDKLTATIKDERFASFTASPAPAPSASPGDPAPPPVVEYTVKGQHPGDTSLVVAQGDECVAIGIHVKPAIGDRFFSSTGVAMSFTPEYHINTNSVTNPATGAVVGTTVFKDQNSGHRAAIPLLFNYRLSDSAQGNVYGTVGFFTNNTSAGLAYGLSYGREQALLTVGLHSENIKDFAPGITNNQTVPNGIGTTVTRRITSPFLALTFPTSLLTQLLGGGSPSSSGSSKTSQ